MAKADDGTRERKVSAVSSHLDSPQVGDLVYDSSISIVGWWYQDGVAPSSCRVRAWIERERIAETDLFFVRSDVSAALNLPAETPTGFRLLGHVPSGLVTQSETEIVVTVSERGGADEFELGRTTVRLLPAALEQRPYGEFVHPGQKVVLHRDHIYLSGPAVAEPSAETLDLLQQYLSAGSSVLDVGCGSGAYGPALLEAGHAWLGLEVSPACWGLLENRNLPFRKTAETATAFPVRPGEFDHAICVEVLEHIRQPDGFVSEMARAVRGRALFSVPNTEVIPYLSAWHVVPWHLLEADHKNFFTRASLHALLRKHFARVEVFSYSDHPLRTPEGVVLHAHLFAVAEK